MYKRQQLPLWLSGTVVAAMVLRSVMEIYRLPLPSGGFCGVVALCFLAGIFIQYKTMFGRERTSAARAAAGEKNSAAARSAKMNVAGRLMVP